MKEKELYTKEKVISAVKIYYEQIEKLIDVLRFILICIMLISGFIAYIRLFSKVYQFDDHFFIGFLVSVVVFICFLFCIRNIKENQYNKLEYINKQYKETSLRLFFSAFARWRISKIINDY